MYLALSMDCSRSPDALTGSLGAPGTWAHTSPSATHTPRTLPGSAKMPATPPEYLLFTESLRQPGGARMWRFLLLDMGTDASVSASDTEPNCSKSRAELLALVRGLEAMDQPGRVRHICGSAYVSRGLERGLRQWRSQGWHWERFGRRVPIRNADLWQRVDHALQFHQLANSASNGLSGQATTDDASQRTSPQPVYAEAAVMVLPKRETGLATTARRRLGAFARGVESLLDSPATAAG